MNVDNILKVADAIEQNSIPDLGFNMVDFYTSHIFYEDMSGHNCGTTACIAGWAAIVSAGKDNIKIRDIETEAKDFLGIDGVTANGLFFKGPSSGFISTTSSQAVRTLRHLAATGHVDWSLPEPVPA